MAECISVEVACAMPERQWVRRVNLPAGSSVMQAVQESGILQMIPAGIFDPSRLGIFARHVAADALLHDGDRVEIYRPLTLDPKDARRRRVK